MCSISLYLSRTLLSIESFNRVFTFSKGFDPDSRQRGRGDPGLQDSLHEAQEVFSRREHERRFGLELEYGYGFEPGCGLEPGHRGSEQGYRAETQANWHQGLPETINHEIKKTENRLSLKNKILKS